MASLAARRRALHLSSLAVLAAALLSSPARSTSLAAPPSPPAVGLDTTAVVAVLRVEAPATDAFLLRGTVPLLYGAWRKPDVTEPFVVLDYDGTPVITQAEVVSRFASAQVGADVAEVIARVRRPPGKKAGDMLEYKVVYWPHQVVAKPAPSMAALINGPIEVPGSVKALLNDKQGVLIEIIDVFGNAYRMAPFDGTSKLELLKHGPMQTQLRISGTLRPSPTVTGPTGTLPHHLGVHVYLTVSSKDEVVGFDVRFHNAHSGLDAADVNDDPLGTVYFRAINLYAPAPWFFVQDFFDPFLDFPSTGQGGYVQFPLVKPPLKGKVHAMKWQQQFHRRLSLAPLDKIDEAQARARGQGLGFAKRGKDPQSGYMHWSWWNPATSRWFPQAHRLPSLDHVGDAALEFQLGKEHFVLETHLVNGTSTGPLAYPISSPVLGYAHPYGTAYGGMTSGLDIFLFDGVHTLEAASLIGYQVATMTHRMQSDRMPNVIYDADGSPTTVEEWKKPKSGGGFYVPFEHFNTPILTSTDAFGLHKAPKFQQEFVQQNALDAPWTTDLLKYGAYDFQHLVRYVRVAKTLAWMANDSLAKDDVRMQAEMFHLSYHDNHNSAGGYIQATGLLWDQNYVAEHGPVGLSFGRGEAWGLDAAVAAYRLGSLQWRSDNRPWLDSIANLLADGQAACSGFIQATITDKFFDSKYRARQIIEQSIIENALVGLDESVYKGVAPGMSAMVDATLVKSLYSMLSPMAWNPKKHAPWGIAAVGPADDSLPPWCEISQVPPDGHVDYVDAFLNWSSFAYGFERTGDPIFLLAAQHQIQGDLLPLMLAQGADNLQNRAALLALMETFAGIGF